MTLKLFAFAVTFCRYCSFRLLKNNNTFAVVQIFFHWKYLTIVSCWCRYRKKLYLPLRSPIFLYHHGIQKLFEFRAISLEADWRNQKDCDTISTYNVRLGTILPFGIIFLYRRYLRDKKVSPTF